VVVDVVYAVSIIILGTCVIGIIIIIIIIIDCIVVIDDGMLHVLLARLLLQVASCGGNWDFMGSGVATIVSVVGISCSMIVVALGL